MKTMNKKVLFSLLSGIFVLFTLSSCLIGGSEIHSTPEIIYASPITRHSTDSIPADTLLIKVTEDGYVLDTLQVGDTALFDLLFSTGYNNMQRITISHDTACSQIHYYHRNQLDSIFLPSSDYERGEFLLDQGVMAVRMQVGYIATQPKENPKLKIQLESDSQYSPGKRTITTPIIPKKDYK